MAASPEKNHQACPCNQNLEWTPPTTDSESSPIASPPRSPNQCFQRAEHATSLLGHNLGNVSPIHPPRSNRKVGTLSSTSIPSHMRSVKMKISSTSSSSKGDAQDIRRNRIYVRIKRVPKRQDNIPPRAHYSFHFHPSVRGSDVQLHIANHYHHAMQSTGDNHSSGNDSAASVLNTELSKAKMEMTERLLHLQTGPLVWSGVDETCRPPEAFVRYLGSVLSKAVELYLKRNTGKVYWIKHVSFWSDLLDPQNIWWNTAEGSFHKVIADKLHKSLLKRMVEKKFIDCNGDQKAQNVLVRACIVFARKNTSHHKT